VTALSLHHLADGIMLVTKAPAWEAWPEGTGIDLGFVSMELATIAATTDKLRKAIGRYTKPAIAGTLAGSAVMNAFAFGMQADGYESYVCPGQREAVRSLLHMPAASTLIVNLPTGSGKTLVGQLPPLLGGPENGLTMFVVPTTALALDQARRMRDILAQGSTRNAFHDLAWHAELPVSTKTAIKQRIRNGTQGILFASPEAVRGALLEPEPAGIDLDEIADRFRREPRIAQLAALPNRAEDWPFGNRRSLGLGPLDPFWKAESRPSTTKTQTGHGAGARAMRAAPSAPVTLSLRSNGVPFGEAAPPP
jgi:hypothetical protein